MSDVREELERIDTGQRLLLAVNAARAVAYYSALCTIDPFLCNVVDAFFLFAACHQPIEWILICVYAWRGRRLAASTYLFVLANIALLFYEWTTTGYISVQTCKFLVRACHEYTPFC